MGYTDSLAATGRAGLAAGRKDPLPRADEDAGAAVRAGTPVQTPPPPGLTRGLGTVMDWTSMPIFFPALVTSSASWFTENCSVNWLNTRISPLSAGLSMAIWIHRTVSLRGCAGPDFVPAPSAARSARQLWGLRAMTPHRMSRKPRVCPPLP